MTDRAARTIVVVGLSLILGLVLVTGSLVASAIGVFYYYSLGLPAPEMVAERQLTNSTLIYDRQGRLLYELFDPKYGRRQHVALTSISPLVVQATIATEDGDFYANSGVNLRGIARAVMSNVFTGDAGSVQGGSSITQQLVKNVLIPVEERSQRSLARKIKEVILAYALTQRYSKDQILEWYLNDNNYANLSYGVESAAQSYFGKSANDLNLPEAAMLAGIPQAPAIYSPLLDLARAKKRQKEVLGLMVRQGYITSEEAQSAADTELAYKPALFSIQAPHFVMFVRELLEQRYGSTALYRQGLKVTTTLDLDFQNYAQDVAKNHVLATGKRFNANNAALVALDTKSGEILSMVGSVDYFNAAIQGQVNMATAERQPGSTFKPITYLTAFMKGWSPATIVDDSPLHYVDDVGRHWDPENNDQIFRGRVSVRTALANSMNVPAVRTILFAGVDPVLNMAHRLGITTLTRENWYGPALTLGGGEVKLLDLTFAYSVLANNGKMRGEPVPTEEREPGFRQLAPVAILKVEDHDGNVIEEYTGPEEQEVVPAAYAYLVTSILSDNPARSLIFGLNNVLHLDDRPVAAKTGTTEDNRDNWTVGYSPDVTVGVWVGNTDNTKMVKDAFGSSNAGPIWHDVMVEFHDGKPVSQFIRPPQVVSVMICAGSGLLAGPGCPDQRTEIFVAGNVPKVRDTRSTLVRLDRRTGLPATAETPQEFVDEHFATVGSDGQPDGSAGRRPASQPGHAPNAPDGVDIASPVAGAFVGNALTISGTANSGPFFTGYVLEYGAGTSPATWTNIVSTGSAVMNGTLGILDTRKLDGVYTIRLTALDRQYGNQTSSVVISVNGPLAGG